MADNTDSIPDATGARDSPNVVVNNPIYISGDARVHQGDVLYPSRQDLKQELHYDMMSDKTDQIRMSNIPVRSFDWVWETPFKTWLRSASPKSDACFWISGKPGSGKSTLIHYLIHSKETKKILRKQSKKYMVLNFFNDYRAGGGIANHQLGLIKCFLFQLCVQFAEVEERLARRYSHISPGSLGEQFGLQLLTDALTSLDKPSYAFIDGLDEHQGDHAYLANILLNLQDHSELKICFASRPESLLVKMFAGARTLHMHQFNGPSISRYIQHALHVAEHFIPNIHSSIDASMQRAIMIRADGVMIWARLVLDRLIEKASCGVSHEDLVQLMDSLPNDLEQIYD